MSLALSLALALAQPSSTPPAAPVVDAKPIGGHISGEDYPRSEWRRRIGGTTGVRMLVNERGRLAACEITASSGSGPLDVIVCRLLQRRFKFSPARDAAGKPVAQWLVLKWTWDPASGINLGNPSFSPER